MTRREGQCPSVRARARPGLRSASRGRQPLPSPSGTEKRGGGHTAAVAPATAGGGGGLETGETVGAAAGVGLTRPGTFPQGPSLPSRQLGLGRSVQLPEWTSRRAAQPCAPPSDTGAMAGGHGRPLGPWLHQDTPGIQGGVCRVAVKR